MLAFRECREEQAHKDQQHQNRRTGIRWSGYWDALERVLGYAGARLSQVLGFHPGARPGQVWAFCERSRQVAFQEVGGSMLEKVSSATFSVFIFKSWLRMVITFLPRVRLFFLALLRLRT